ISSLKIFWGEMPSAPRKLALYAIILSIVIKELWFQYKYRVGKKYRSAALISDAWHHRSDSLSSIAALVGVGAAMIGESYNMSLLLYGDAVASIIVSFIVIKVGYKLAKESSLVMMEQVLDSEDVKTYKQTVRSVDGVLRIDQMHARTHGSYVVIDIKISVDPDLTVKKGHHIATNVKHTLMDKHDDIADVLVHVKPYEPELDEHTACLPLTMREMGWDGRIVVVATALLFIAPHFVHFPKIIALKSSMRMRNKSNHQQYLESM